MQSPFKNKLVYQDLLTAPEDGNRYELLDGDVCVTPAPSPAYQRIVLGLTLRFVEYFHGRGLGEVFVSPIDVILTERDVLEPDILVVADPAQISTRGIEGAPLLVVEVLSPSTSDGDRTVKAQRYSRLGVPHSWLVDPDEKRIDCLRVRGGVYELVVAAGGDQVLTHPDWDGLRIELRGLWR